MSAFFLFYRFSAYDSQGKKVWEREIDIYGKVKKGDSIFVPFLYQGQYFDSETELAYNRFRYYSPETGTYISQDPIRLEGGMANMYSYVRNSNFWLDPLGLAETFLTRLGNFGEQKVMESLNNSGNYTNVFQVQNASNQGIDIIAKTSDGVYDIFEVKTTSVGKYPLIKGDQLEPDDFVSSRLANASLPRNEGSFRISQTKAQEIANNIGKKYVVNVEVTRGNNGKWYVSNIEQLDWDAEANRIKGNNH